jgi:prepilin-type N-terminal cleavage/methylation domain-containing protein
MNERSDNDDGVDSGGRFRPHRGPLSSPISSTDFDGLSNKVWLFTELKDQARTPNTEIQTPHFHLTPDSAFPYTLGMDTKSSFTGNPRESPGFTLIELLVVIGIIAMLAAMLIPTINSSLRKGKKVACLSNLHQIAVGGQLMLDEYEDDLPPDDDDCAAYNNFAAAALEHLPFLKCSIEIFDCPSNKGIPNSAPTTIQPADLPEDCTKPPGPVETDYEFSQYVNECDTGGGSQNGIEDPNRVAYVWDYPWMQDDPRAHERGINCAYMDGRAEFLSDEEKLKDGAGNWDASWQQEGHIF